MSKFTAEVTVLLKPVVNDPQGLVIHSSLQQLGYAGVESVRVGKQIVIEVEASSQQVAESEVRQMCEKLLRNPVIEDFSLAVKAAVPA